MGTLLVYWKSAIQNMEEDLRVTIEMMDGSPSFEIEHMFRGESYRFCSIEVTGLDLLDIVEQIDMHGQLTNLAIADRPGINGMYELYRYH